MQHGRGGSTTLIEHFLPVGSRISKHRTRAIRDAADIIFVVNTLFTATFTRPQRGP